MEKVVLEAGSKKSVVSILEGDKAIALLNEDAFRQQWSILLQAPGNTSVFQDASFVLPWYKENLQEYSPVIVVAFADGLLVGLLTLGREIHAAKGKPSNRLIGAGNFFALYQSWIVLPDYSLEFWNQGLQLLLKKIPGSLINLKFLPDVEIFRTMEHFPNFRRMTVLDKSYNPVLDFQVEGFEKIFGKRHFKSKINRLNRAGKVKFEKITDERELEKVFPQIAEYYSIRQGAAFNKTPYSQGVEDWQVFLEWLKSGVLNVTGLWLDEVLISLIIMINDYGKTAHLAGLITYSPRHAKLSPGLVHLYLASHLLKEDSFQHLKLSPGYDAYKERFSNRQEEIYELLISASQFQIIKRKLRILVRKVLLNRGIRPMEFDVWLSKMKSKWLNRIWGFPKRFKTGNMTFNELISKLDSLAGNSEDSLVNFDNQLLDSLLLVHDRTFHISRWEFLEDSLKRLEENEKFVAYVFKGELKVCIWYTGEAVTLQELSQVSLKGNVTKIFVSHDF